MPHTFNRNNLQVIISSEMFLQRLDFLINYFSISDTPPCNTEILSDLKLIKNIALDDEQAKNRFFNLKKFLATGVKNKVTGDFEKTRHRLLSIANDSCFNAILVSDNYSLSKTVHEVLIFLANLKPLNEDYCSINTLAKLKRKSCIVISTGYLIDIHDIVEMINGGKLKLFNFYTHEVFSEKDIKIIQYALVKLWNELDRSVNEVCFQKLGQTRSLSQSDHPVLLDKELQHLLSLNILKKIFKDEKVFCTENLFDELIDLAEILNFLIKNMHISLRELLKVRPDLRPNFFYDLSLVDSHSYNFDLLINRYKISLARLAELNCNLYRNLFTASPRVLEFLFNKHDPSLDKFLNELSIFKHEFIYNLFHANAKAIDLLLSRFSLRELADLNWELCQDLFNTNSTNLTLLLSKVSLSYLSELERKFICGLLGAREGVLEILLNKFSVQFLSQLNRSLLHDMLAANEIVLNALFDKYKFSLSDLLCLDHNVRRKLFSATNETHLENILDDNKKIKIIKPELGFYSAHSQRYL